MRLPYRVAKDRTSMHGEVALRHRDEGPECPASTARLP